MIKNRCVICGIICIWPRQTFHAYPLNLLRDPMAESALAESVPSRQLDFYFFPKKKLLLGRNLWMPWQPSRGFADDRPVFPAGSQGQKKRQDEF
jgi:hypothetical protein